MFVVFVIVVVRVSSWRNSFFFIRIYPTVSGFFVCFFPCRGHACECDGFEACEKYVFVTFGKLDIFFFGGFGHGGFDVVKLGIVLG